jgi:hypothetical protein
MRECYTPRLWFVFETLQSAGALSREALRSCPAALQLLDEFCKTGNPNGKMAKERHARVEDLYKRE